ncbi:uncharacterized protein LOC124788706, partial [Schistocerca piceifrons]|uniref:uncharacterized protein LOC124788706 n=1 Tax=Schistocerca piceifrons TaxID=274613 RepID=UPI001F5E4228
VTEPIIGADFLAHYNLLSDLRNSRLVDNTTGLTTSGFHRDAAVHTAKVIQVVDGEYAELLRRFSALMLPPGAPNEVRHDTVHYTETTDGPPTSCRPRRLSPDRLKISKAEFDCMFREGVVRPSDSPWTSPLHLAPKKEGAWRLCGDYRALNSHEMTDAFEAVNKSIANAALLAHPDPTATLALVVDASQTAIGAVLQQQYSDTWQPLAFFSRKLTTSQRRSTYGREL